MSADCEHQTPLEMGYGYGRASDWRGIGITWRCPKCHKCLWFDDDTAEMWSEEKAHNDAKRKENAQWEPKEGAE